MLKDWELGDTVSPCKVLGSKEVFEKCLDGNDGAFQVSSSSRSHDRDTNVV